MSAPYIPFFVGDYLRKTPHLTTEQHGAYLLMIFAMFSGDGTLPNDDKKLARITRLSNSRWASNKGDLLSFFQIDGDILTHEKVTEVSKKYEEKVARLAQNGSRGGLAKALKNKEKPLANATNLLEKNSSNQNQNQNHSKKLKEKDALEPSISEAVQIWNDMAKANNLPVCIKAVGKRAVSLQARLKEIGIDGWRALVASIPSQPFLVGKAGERPFKADIDFLVTDSSFTKIIEGRYTTDRKPIDLTQSKPKQIDKLRAARTYLNQMDNYGEKFWDRRWTEHSGLTEAEARLLVSQAEQEQTTLALPN
jgi:uncharacterized protein YdaU (DUF1376 family)